MEEAEFSPLALPFEKALSVSKFSEQIRAAADNRLRREISLSSQAAARPAIVIAQVVTSSRGISVYFKGGIPRGAKFLEDAAGKAIPTLVDGKSATFLKNARVIGKTGKAAKAGATAVLMAVEVAHAVSGHDNAKRLRKVDRAVEVLIHAHEASLRSKLEAIYRHSKGILHKGIGALTDDDRSALNEQCRDLMELRSQWRHQFMHELQKIERADAGFMNRLLWWRKDRAQQRSRTARAEEAGASIELVHLMHFSLLLQTSLATAVGNVDQFVHATLPDEAESWRRLQSFAKRRAYEIVGGRAREFRPFLTALDDLVNVWTAFPVLENQTKLEH